MTRHVSANVVLRVFNWQAPIQTVPHQTYSIKQFHINDIHSIGHMAALSFFSCCHPDRSPLACVKHEFKSKFDSIRHFGRFLMHTAANGKFLRTPSSIFMGALWDFFRKWKTSMIDLLHLGAWHCWLICTWIVKDIPTFPNYSVYQGHMIFAIFNQYHARHFLPLEDLWNLGERGFSIGLYKEPTLLKEE